MSRKIVICPSFASSHFIECHIQNMIDVIDPDVIIYNEGLFSQGPENKGHVDSEEFREKYILDPKGSNVGFDFRESVRIVMDYNRPIQLTTDNIVIQSIKYIDDDVNKCALNAMSSMPKRFGEFEVEDIIFPLEPDAFLLESDKKVIQEEISKLLPGEGLKCLWMDFLETQYYTEAINLEQPKHRRFCYCFDNMENYKKAMDGFMSQSYPKLKFTDKFFIRHYPWFVYDKWKELRYDLIYRSDPQYWKDFENGLQQIRRESRRIVNGAAFKINHDPLRERIIIRPSRQDAGRYAQFIDIEHPAAIKNHPNYVV